MENYRKRVTLFAALFLFWILLSESLETFNLLIGASISLFIMHLTWTPFKAQSFIVGEHHNPVKRISYALAFIPVFGFTILSSAFSVARHAVRIPLKIKPGVIEYKPKLKNRFSLVILANYITLTPGTLTMDLDTRNRVMYVHCLNVNDKNIKSDIENMEKWLEVIFE